MEKQKLIITGPERILIAIRDLILAVWEADYHDESIDALEAKIVEVGDK